MTTRWTHGQAITWDGRPGYIQHLGPQHLTIEVERPGRRPQVLTVRADSPRLRILQAMLEQYRDCEADSFAFDPAKSGLTQQEVDAAFGITPAKRKRLNEKYGRK